MGATVKSSGVRNQRPRRIAAAALVCAALAVAAPRLAAQSPANVAVIINDASPASQRIGQYYAEKRGLPASNVIHIRTSTEERINRQAYVETIENPIGAALGRHDLQDRIHYLVLTKGVPLRIEGTAGPKGTAASVDSELTLLYRRLTGARGAGVNGPIDNPYYLGDKGIGESKPFSHRDHDIYLVTRLDAFSIAEALALVNRGVAPAPDGKIILDQRGDTTPAVGDTWLAEAARRLAEAGRGARVTLDESSLPVRNVDGVLGYYSWGSNDTMNQVRELKVGFVAGAIAATLVSSDARTFEQPPDTWVPSTDWGRQARQFAGTPQSLMADLIREGVTGAGGNITEPLIASMLRPQILFPAYTSGYTLAESFYLALPHLSWQSVIVGDPLCRPAARDAVSAAALEEPIDQATRLPGLFARRRLEAARAAMPGAPARAVELVVQAEGHVARADKPAARAALEEATALAPDLGAAALQLALLYEEAGQLDRAIQRYRRVIELQPRNAIALNNLAYRLAMDKRAYGEAAPLARKAVTLAPNIPTVLDTLGWIEHLMGNNAEAARIFTRALKQNPRIAEVRLHAAIVYAATGATAAAAAELKEAISIDPAFADRDDAKALRTRLEKR